MSMISEFKLSNFKAFGKEQTVPLKPITLVFGPNSAGKSSILHSLLFAHEAIRSGNLDIRQTQIGGDSVDLGGFEQLTHRRDRERAVVLSYRMDSILNKEARTSDRSPLDDVEVRATLQFSRAEVEEFDKKVNSTLLAKIKDLSEENDVDAQELAYAAYTKLAEEAGHDVSAWDFRFEDSTDEMIKPVLRRFEILINGQSLMQASSRAGGELRIDRLSLSHPAFRAIVDAIVTSNTTSDSLSESDVKVVEGVANEMIPQIRILADGLLCKLDTSGAASGEIEQLAALSRSQREDEISNQARLFLPRYLSRLVVQATDKVRDFIQSLEYLGPLRCYPPRHISLETIKEDNSSEGLDAWVTVLKDVGVREKVNQWLDSDFLSSRYKLEVSAQIPITQAAEALENAFSDIVEEKENEYLTSSEEGTLGELSENPYSSWDLKNLHREMMDEIVQRCQGSHERKLSLIDRRTGTIVSHRDIGVGVSQLLPVLVKAYARKNRVIAIEQPEIHLHPALQAELADVFIESALGEQKNTFLLETHSEHLILRLLRRIRETADGSLPPGAAPINPNDVAILYVKPGGDGSQVIQMIPNTDGDFDNPWPDGFFPERAKELF